MTNGEPTHRRSVRQATTATGPETYRRLLLIGGGAREHALGEAMCRDSRAELFVFAHNRNPGLHKLASEFELGDERDVDHIVKWAKSRRIAFAVIGLEDPLAVGVPDALQGSGIPTVGPVRAAAQLETSKLFLRELMQRHKIRGNADYLFITDAAQLEYHLTHSTRQFALKPVGLTAGKGVKVMGVQLTSVTDAIEYGKSVITDRIGGVAGLLLEERLEGAEFTLQAFVDGDTVKAMPLVKDYKLSEAGDEGENTGSMGSYSQRDGSLDFLGPNDRGEAVQILEDVVAALHSEGTVYQGIMYGQFMKTRVGIKLVEINARFGDPEAINVLSVLRTSFVDVCDAILRRTLGELRVDFESNATVCKYVTPRGYPTKPVLGQPIRLNLPEIEKRGVKAFFAKVEAVGEGQYLTTPSRSIALLGTGDSVEEAHNRVEEALRFVSGDYHLRHDIGTKALIDRAFSAVGAEDVANRSAAARA